MNLNQLRYICEVARANFNISSAAKDLHTAQSAVSKQIRLLEDELKVEIFDRDAHRLIGLTRHGEHILGLARSVLADIARMKQFAAHEQASWSGPLNIVVSHPQARFVIADALKAFVNEFPRIPLALQHGNHAQVVEQVISGKADIGISTSNKVEPGLASLLLKHFHCALIVPYNHPLTRTEPLTLEAIGAYPFIAYRPGFEESSTVIDTFEGAGVPINITISAADIDVIKTCVERQLGVAILSEMTLDLERATGIQAIPAGHLFPPVAIYVIVRRHSYLSRPAYRFLQLCHPALTRAHIEEALIGIRGAKASGSGG